MVINKMGKLLIIQSIQKRTHIICSAIRRNDLLTFDFCPLIHLINILDSHKTVQWISRLCTVKIFVKQSLCKIFFDIFLLKGIGDHAVFIHNICHQNISTCFRHTLRLRKRFDFLLHLMQMIHWSKYKGYIKAFIRKFRQLHGIPLKSLYLTALLL